MCRNEVNRGVCGHYAERSHLLDARDPRWQKYLPELALRHVHRASLHAAERFTLAGEVAQPRDDTIRRGDVVALHAADNALGDAAAVPRVLAEPFLVAAQTRIAIRLDDHGEQLMDTHGASFTGRRGVNALDQVQVPCTAQRQPFRKHRAMRTCQAVCTFLGLQERNPEPRPLDGDPLKLVEEGGLGVWALVEDRVGQREETAARTKSLYKRALGEAAAVFALGSHVLAELTQVDARHVHLPDLLFQRHAPEQILDSLVDRLPGIAIQRNLCDGRRCEKYS